MLRSEWFLQMSHGKNFRLYSEELKSLSPVEICRLVHHEDRAVFFNRIESRLQGEQADSSFEFRAVRKDGSIVWMEAFSSRD